MKKLILLAVLFTFAMVCSTESFARTIPQTSQTESQQAGAQKQMFAQDEGDAPKKAKKAKKDKKEDKKPAKKSAKKAKKDED
ncbi:MAG: hypothetical protein NTX75_18490 [Proteobacteria bacterium]|nr:hypothetical protein [Pseudomonadota bacterium]